jgi:glyoxylase-like metal-dependent hydrolase (beta-lactamase superfamily II)
MRCAVWGTMLAVVMGHSAMGQAGLPDAARGIAVPANKGYAVEQIGEGLYFVTDGFYTTMFMTTGMGTIVVDAPPSLGDKMLQAIRGVTNEPIRWVVYSHSHADHIGAAGMYPKEAMYIAHKETLARLERMNDIGRLAPYGAFVGGQAVPPPTVTFDGQYELKVGNQSLTLSYRGNNHEPGNIYIYAPRQRVLMQVDVIFPGWTPFKDLAIAEDITGYIRAHDVILSFPFDKMVTGHWNRYATRQDVEMQRDYIHDIERNAVAALKSVDFYAVASRIGPQNLARLFDRYLSEVAQECANATVENWKARLAGVDVWTNSHCQQIVNALRVD